MAQREVTTTIVVPIYGFDDSPRTDAELAERFDRAIDQALEELAPGAISSMIEIRVRRMYPEVK